MSARNRGSISGSAGTRNNSVHRIIGIGEDPEEALRTRDENRAKLSRCIADVADLKQNYAQTASLQQENQMFRQELQQLKSQLQQLLSSTQGSAQQVSALQRDLQSSSQQVSALQRDLQSVKGVAQNVQQMQSDLQALKGTAQNVQQIQRDLQAVKGATQEVNQMKNQLQEFRGVAQQTNQMMSELQSLKGVNQEINQMKSQLQSVQSATQEINQMKSQLQSVQGGVTQEVNQMKSQLQSVQGVTQEVNQMRNQLQSVQSASQEINQVKSQLQSVQGVTQEINQVRSQLQSVQSATQEINQMKSQLQSVQGVTQEVTQLRSQLQSVQSATGEINQMKGELQSVKGNAQEINQMKSQLQSVQSATQEINQMKSQLQSVKGATQEINQMKSQLQEVKGATRQVQQQSSKLREHDSTIAELKRGTQSKDVITAVQAKVDLVTMQFNDLKQQIFSRGLLAPKPPPPEDPEEAPPVGTVQLGEDAFTARLLIHLGFMKATVADAWEQCDSRKSSRTFTMLSSDEQSEEFEPSEDEVETIDEDNIHGITDMAELGIEEGRPGYIQVTALWLVVCILTFSLQVLIVLILISGAKDAGEGCFAKPLIRYGYEWWLLHLSKGLAIAMAGVLMGQELMDVVNYAMVSVLVEPHLNIEMVFFATARTILTMLIAFANVVIFTYLRHAANVWINMTALAFIGELGTGMLSVARRGVFGHAIMKTMTALNFELTFTKEYPWWFIFVRSIVLAIASMFVVFFSVMAFLAEDINCKHHHHGGNGTHVIVAGGGDIDGEHTHHLVEGHHR